jgi:hypothetical protein
MSTTTEAQEKTIYGQMVEELKERIANGEELDEINDYYSTEFIESYLPVYHSGILREWKDMPHTYTDRGAAELGTTGGIFELMTADLYLYYTDLFTDAVAEVESDLEEAESEAE